ncbi:hypothetical protein PQX77_013553 [Marasmius sp. AFHP31]|nr:hypothetical protein PQX77_013553 [Marasmius sp. AFHP31]
MRSAILFLLAIVALASASVLPTVIERDAQSSRFRLMMWFRKSPNLTFKEFSDRWRLPHADLFLNTPAVKRNLLKFEQVITFPLLDAIFLHNCLSQLHVNQEWKQKLVSQGYTVPNFDGIMITEAATMDKLLECFTSDEYNGVVLPDSFTFLDMASTQHGAFEIATSINKEPNPPAYKVIRTDTKRVLVDFSHKNTISYANFTDYFRNVNPPNIDNLIRSTGVGKDVTKYEQLTLTPNQPPFFTPLLGWDAVAQVAGPSFQYLLDTSKKPQFVSLMQQDSPNFVNVAAGYQVIPVDVVSFQIPK